MLKLKHFIILGLLCSQLATFSYSSSSVKTHMTFTGSSGYINVPTASVSSGLSLTAYTDVHNIQKGEGDFTLRAGIGIGDFAEIYAGTNARISDHWGTITIPTSAIFGAKFNVLKLSELIDSKWSNLNLGLQSTFLIEGIGSGYVDSMSDLKQYFSSAQVLGIATWEIPFVDISLAIGKTFGLSKPSPTQRTIDIGIASQVWIIDSYLVSFSLVFDYSNFNNNLHLRYQDFLRGMQLSASANVGFLNNIISVSLGGNDMIHHDGRSLFTSLGVMLPF